MISIAVVSRAAAGRCSNSSLAPLTGQTIILRRCLVWFGYGRWRLWHMELNWSAISAGVSSRKRRSNITQGFCCPIVNQPLVLPKPHSQPVISRCSGQSAIRPSKLHSFLLMMRTGSPKSNHKVKASLRCGPPFLAIRHCENWASISTSCLRAGLSMATLWWSCLACRLCLIA